MGARIAYQNSAQGPWDLQHFNNVIVAKLVVPKGNWIVTGRLIITSVDDDPQSGSVQIVHQANVAADNIVFWLLTAVRHMAYVQTIIRVEEQDTITLNCNTYKGEAEYASLIAFDVDEFEVM